MVFTPSSTVLLTQAWSSGVQSIGTSSSGVLCFWNAGDENTAAACAADTLPIGSTKSSGVCRIFAEYGGSDGARLVRI